MKKQILIFGATLAMVATVQSQDIPQSQLPSVVVNVFNKQFPKVTDLEWEMEGSLYNADFETGWNIDHEVWYTKEGKMVKHKEDISVIDLPKAVSQKIATDFKGYSLHDLERIMDNGKVVYKMELKALIEQDWDVVLDANGNILSKVAD